MANYKRKDAFYHEAKQSGYRSRAAFKLLEMDKRHRLFRPGKSVVDLGCFPGGWLQVACEKTGEKGRVVGVDLRAVAPIKIRVGGSIVSPHIIKGDITDASVRQQIIEHADGRVDVVLSDLSPKLSGIRFRDVAFAAELVSLSHQFCREVLRPGGTFVAKMFPGEEADTIFEELRADFSRVARARLRSTRQTSTEFYFVAERYRGATSEAR